MQRGAEHTVFPEEEVNIQPIWEDWIPFSSDRTLSPYCCYAATHTLKHKLIQADLTGGGGCD